MSAFMQNNEAYDEAVNELLRYLVATKPEIALDCAGYLDDIVARMSDSGPVFNGLAAHIRQLLVAGAIDEATHPYRPRKRP